MHRRSFVTFLVVLLVGGCFGLIFPAKESRWYFTEYNWFFDDNLEAVSANAGSYFIFHWTNSTKATLLINTTLAPTTGPFASLLCSVGGAPWVDFMLNHSVDSLSLSLGKKFDQGNSYVTKCMIRTILVTTDRWVALDGAVRVQGVELDDGAVLLEPPVRSLRALAHWDSIGDGTKTLVCSKDPFLQNDASRTFFNPLGAALDTEFSVVAFSAQGYASPGSGNVPPLIDPNNPSFNSSWNKIAAGRMRKFDQRAPDFIVSGLGTNDFNHGSTPQEVKEALEDWLRRVRVVMPDTPIVIILPFGRFYADAISKTVNRFLEKTKDTRIYLISLPAISNGLNTYKTPSVKSCDGIHPNEEMHAEIAARLSVALASIPLPGSWKRQFSVDYLEASPSPMHHHHGGGQQDMLRAHR